MSTIQRLLLLLALTQAVEPALAARRARLFTIGGYGKSGPILKSVDVYDVKTATWKQAADLPITTYAAAAAAVDGRGVYTIGGWTSDGASAQTLVYDAKAANSTWTRGPDMTTERYSHAVVVLANRIYAIGGSGVGDHLSSVEVLDVTNPAGKWALIAPMSVPRYNPAAAVLSDRIYVVGGNNGGGGGEGILNSVEAYDPKTNSWSPVASMNVARYEHFAAAVDGKLYAMGGYSGGRYLSSVEVFDPKTTTWSLLADMPAPRYSGGAFALDGMVYLVGGTSNTVPLNTIAMYNPKTDAWSVLSTRMPTARVEHAVALLLDDVGTEQKA